MRRSTVAASRPVEGLPRSPHTLHLARGDAAIAVETDVRSEEQIQRLVAIAVEKLGEPTIVMNIAGIFPGGDTDVADLTVEAWANVMAVNLRSKHTLPYLRKVGGAIVSTASTHGSAADTSLTGYGAPKPPNTQPESSRSPSSSPPSTGFGGGCCNAINPGTTTSPPAQQLPEEVKDIFRRQNLNPEMPTPEQQAKVFAFLASDDAGGVNGQEVKVDAGLLSHQPMVAESRALGVTTV